MTITDIIPTSTGTAPHVTVLVDRCAGCQDCIVRCPTGALDLEPEAWVAIADDALCVGCQQCVRLCAFSAITVSGDPVVAPRTGLAPVVPTRLLADYTETRPPIATWEAAKLEAARCLACPDPTCVRGCPAHNDIPAFISAVGDGDLAAAHATLRRTSVLPDICSRVCDHAVQCEGACTWSLAGGEPVAIGALERFITDHAPVPDVVPARATGLRVAVVGSGPAGLAAAWQLREGGAEVTVIDADTAAGGLLRWGIPDFTLPSEIAGRPVEALERAGVRFELGRAVDADGLDRLRAGFDAVVWAAGAGFPLALRVPGSDLAGVWSATKFLTAAHAAMLRGAADLGALGAPTPAGRAPRVLVVGAGNTAMDVARTARRLGADALCIDWMDRHYAAVRPDELEEAETEGVAIRFCVTLARIEGADGRVTGAVLQRTRQRRAGARPSVLRGGGERVDVDLVVAAMGYRAGPETERLPGLPVAKTPPATADGNWLASGMLAASPAWARHQPVGRVALGREHARVAAAAPVAARLWCAGDALTGPSTVVEAMAQGRVAARAILAARA